MSDKPNSGEKQVEEERTSTSGSDSVDRKDVVYKLRDLKDPMVEAWKSIFGENDFFNGRFEVQASLKLKVLWNCPLLVC